MGNIPSDRNGLFTFAQAHGAVWGSNASMIGLSTGQTAAVKAAIDATTAASADADAARAASKNATRGLSTSFTDLRTVVSDAVRTINNFALNAADPSVVYDKAQIAPPQDPSALPPPTAPFELAISLNPSTGSLTVRWKASQPQGVSGVVYNVSRRIGGSAPFAQVALTGEKRFEDVTIPAGTSQIAYTIQAQRGSQTSPMSNIIEVRFGMGGPGLAGTRAGSSMTVTEFAADGSEVMKMAA